MSFGDVPFSVSFESSKPVGEVGEVSVPLGATMGAFPDPPLEPAVPCRLFTCLGAEMGLEGERVGGREGEGRPGGRLGFDRQLSLAPRPTPIPAGRRSEWGESSSQGNVCSCLEQTWAGDLASLWLPRRLGPLEFMFIFTAWIPWRLSRQTGKPWEEGSGLHGVPTMCGAKDSRESVGFPTHT